MPISMQKSKVSVVISTFNRPCKLLQAVRSVIAQTYDNWELVVVGDGCAEETAIAMASIDDKRIRYINEPMNHGLSDHGSTPKNRGIENSDGEYIAYLDDDDVFFPSHLEESVRFLEENPSTDLLYGCSQVFKFIQPGRSFLRDRDFDPGALDKSPFINTCEIVHRRSLFDKLDEKWRTVGYYNDYDFLKRVNRVAKISHSKHLAATQHFSNESLVYMERRRVRRRGSAPPCLSIVIGVRGRVNYLRQCLIALNHQTASKDMYEVIVVDQDDGVESRKACGLFSGRIQHIALNNSEAYHRGWVCNVGAKMSIGQVLCFLDCDCIVTDDFIEILAKKINEQVDNNFLFRLRRKWLPEDKTSDYFNGKLSYSDAYSGCDLDTNVTAVGSGTCVEREVFNKIRGFDEKYDKGWGFEDTDLFDRLITFGCRLVDDFPKALQMHLWHPTSGHERVQRGDHYSYFIKMKRLRTRDDAKYIYRNEIIDWGETVREVFP